MTSGVRATADGIAPTPERAWYAASLAGVFSVCVMAVAWLCDDAFITFRTVDNFVNGHGLRWNVAERVQAFTHPLWALLWTAVYAVTREVQFSVFAVCALLAFTTAWIIVRRLAVSRGHAAIAVVALCSSRAVVEYSTSGLENGLTHLLLALLAWACLEGQPTRARWRRVLWLGSGLMLNRLDAMWLALGPTLYCAWQLYRAERRAMPMLQDFFVGMSPLWLWLTFATAYYGFPFPNTAYAKLNTGIPSDELWWQGLLYAQRLVMTDPASALSLLAAAVLALRPRTPWRERLWLLGAWLYVVYVLRVGGDFMQGRFFSAPVVVATIGIARAAPLRDVRVLSASVIAWSLLGVHAWFTPASPGRADGIADERAHYRQHTGLWSAKPGATLANYEMSRRGVQAAEQSAAHDDQPVVFGVVGMYGFFAGPRLHIVDELALTDALLARLPSKRDYKWRIGHFDRVVPPGYLETLRSGELRLHDARLARYYAALRTVIVGELWTVERWRNIWRLNTGGLNHLIDRDRYRHPGQLRVQLAEVSTPLPHGTSTKHKGVRKLHKSGIDVALGALRHDATLSLSVSADDAFQVEWMRGGALVGAGEVQSSSGPGLRVVRVHVPPAVRHQGFDHVRVVPRRGVGFYVGHLSLD